jgi:hypothetical protein
MNSKLLVSSAAVALTLAVGSPVQAAGLLNDTGSYRGVVAGAYATSCSGTGQDAEFGRDVTNKLSKDGRLGFAFRKMCNSGELAGVGTCPANPALGTGSDEWGCTQDRLTGLVWEVKTASGTRAYTNTYTHAADASAGSALAYVVDVNTAGMCGSSNWRLPTRAELQGLVDYGVTSAPRIDTTWFPNTSSTFHWASEGLTGGSVSAWYVNFNNGNVNVASRTTAYPVRLVRQ